MSDLDALAATLDPDVFDPDRKFSKQPAALVQVGTRRHMAYEGAERVLAAGWVPAERLESTVHAWENERDALAATLQRVRDLHSPRAGWDAHCIACGEDRPCPTIRALDGTTTTPDPGPQEGHTR